MEICHGGYSLHAFHRQPNRAILSWLQRFSNRYMLKPQPLSGFSLKKSHLAQSLQGLHLLENRSSEPRRQG
jgi:hypothetical protein